ncbi:MAG: hypothetical protein ACT4R6_09970 [Gemmatimonadaceae bacterium]
MRGLFTALGALVFGACSQEPSVPKLRDDMILRLTASKSAIRMGESDTITVSATNNFGERVSIRFANSCHVFAYIRTPRGAIVTPGRGWVCLPVVSVLNFAVDETRLFRFIWTGLSEFSGGLQPSALPPGEYFATATMQAGDFAVHAPPVRITLLP